MVKDTIGEKDFFEKYRKAVESRNNMFNKLKERWEKEDKQKDKKGRKDE